MRNRDRYLKIVEWSDEDQCYIGRVPGLSLGGVHGDKEEIVYSELCEVVDEWIQLYEKKGLALPEGTSGKHYSGKFNLRVGEELHELLNIESLKSGESLNSYCVKTLRNQVGL